MFATVIKYPCVYLAYLGSKSFVCFLKSMFILVHEYVSSFYACVFWVEFCMKTILVITCITRMLVLSLLLLFETCLSLVLVSILEA